MPRVLVCASTVSHIQSFHLPYLRYFNEQGFEVHVAAQGDQLPKELCITHSIDMSKRFFSVNNLRAANYFRRLIKTYRFDLILTHTSLAAFLCRLALLFAGKKDTMVINTVHGYFFFKGCGFFKKAVYYLPERFLAGVKDYIVTMNEEDTIAARGLHRPGGAVFRVPGMGVDESRFHPASAQEKKQARLNLSLPEDAFVLVYAAEFSGRKNHIELIRAMPEIIKSVPKAVLLLCGTGLTQEKIKAETARLGLNTFVRFLGFCRDIENIYKACDMAVSVSQSEGLPFNIVEAQLCALAVAASSIRGHTDLIEHGETGWLYPPGDRKALADIIAGVFKSEDKGDKQRKAAVESAGHYTLKNAYPKNTACYRHVIRNSFSERN
ncbi:MAG: glycosyltransferase family 4 protein [Clostridiales bacterium]|nr:glycosyltransferase family 4 protein [Clostridiales bacterium]